MRDRPTILWTVQRLGKEVTCQARLVPHGIEVDIAHDGRVILTRVFENDSDALAWADGKRTTRTLQGWTDVEVGRSSERPS